MRKAELEDHHNQCEAKEAVIREMVRGRQFPDVFSICTGSFDHVVPAMKYRKLAAMPPESRDFLAFQVICRYAPALFEHLALESLRGFVAGTRLLARHENGYLDASEAALAREESARSIWDCIENQPGIQEGDLERSLSIPENTVLAVLDIWHELGIVVRQPEHNDSRVSLRTCLEEESVGVCHHCGVQGKGPKEVFLRSVTCQKCGDAGYYYIRYDHPTRQQA